MGVPRVYSIPLIIDDNTLKNIDYPYYVSTNLSIIIWRSSTGGTLIGAGGIAISRTLYVGSYINWLCYIHEP
jgi:hypothetical protein